MTEVVVEQKETDPLIDGDGDDEVVGSSKPFGTNTGAGDEGHENIGMVDTGDKSLEWDPTAHDVSTSTQRGSAEGDEHIKRATSMDKRLERIRGVEELRRRFPRLDSSKITARVNG